MTVNNQGLQRNYRGQTYCECGSAKRRYNKFCDACREKGLTLDRHTELESIRTPRARKDFIVRGRGWQCEICRLTTWLEKPIPLELDHIDGNADNNTRDNLRLVCANCHAQTETYKAQNKFSGSLRQLMRRERYKNGQTY